MSSGPDAHRRIRAAVERAADDALQPRLTAPDGRSRRIELVIGDPQAPFEKVLTILDHHHLLGDDGRLRPEVALVSIGDHFDYGRNPEPPAAQVEQSGRLLLAWLAAHPPDQVTLIIGNHDLGRVGELVAFDDAAFEHARQTARDVRGDSAREQRFLHEFPALPSSEIARRDFNGFSAAQREIVVRLLRAGRFLVARAHGTRTLLCHAGVTQDDVDGLADAASIAAFLNERLARSVAGWNEREALVVPGLHQPGNADQGEGGGVFYHRPCHPAQARRASFSGPFRRRYDPRGLPPGIVQVIGHIRDNKCRELLGEWAAGREARDGELRHLVSDGREVRYATGLPNAVDPALAQVIFVDGGMNYARVQDYELLDPHRLAC
jgi:hypothetical protein